VPTVTVQLPERLARSLGLTTVARLAAELEGERIVLRHAERAGERAAETSTGGAEEAAPAAEPEQTEPLLLALNEQRACAVRQFDPDRWKLPPPGPVVTHIAAKTSVSLRS
jgi:antitoxin component of MazEF toxin-antitoxin module